MDHRKSTVVTMRTMGERSPSSKESSTLRSVVIILKVVQMVLLLACLLTVRLGGKDQNPMTFGSLDASLFVWTTLTTCLVTVVSCLVTTLASTLGSPPSLLQMILVGKGALLCCATGSIAILFDKGELVEEEGKVRLMKSVLQHFGASTSFNQDGTPLAVGILSLAAATVFFLDLAICIRNKKIYLKT